eukprot:1101009-Prymnesium_polylepis.1
MPGDCMGARATGNLVSNTDARRHPDDKVEVRARPTRHARNGGAPECDPLPAPWDTHLRSHPPL